MKFQIKITSFKTLDQVKDYYSAADYIQLLDLFGFPDAESAEEDSLRELLMMAITDYEPNEAAAIVLTYKLSGDLSKGQIEQISNDMLLDKIAEEYPEISLHATLFHVNQLLHKAFNGRFPNTKASQYECTLTPLDKTTKMEMTKEGMLKLLDAGLSDSNLIKRLFGDKMTGNAPFPEAESILWDMQTTDGKNFKVLTSEYWLCQDDWIADEFEGDYKQRDEEED
ncbi:hypothetical protein [Aquiflexum gelatinilyticum]|uniref:Uncharacterized protein n=1 Tax=Aquiflexum gelatinilyticum TaxID=2961943 RepID=A0A9X2P8T5_9BACT|nr:hypothetical protein [Aquiflexum gelatinilyticum]MCR9015314.1 hypothetical protein [Aquiflexum gelatinilyticum]